MIRLACSGACVILGLLCLCSRTQNPDVTTYHTAKILIGDEFKDPYIKLLLPQGYVLGQEKGPDYMVFNARPKDTAGLASKATLGIYIGHHPNRIFPAGDSISLTTADVGTRYRWTSWMGNIDSVRAVVTDAIDDSLLTDIMPRTSMGAVRELQIHFFITATDERVARLLMRSAESVELVRQE